MFIAALFTAAKTWKQPKCPSLEDWIQMRSMYTMGYYSAIRKDEVLPFAATRMDLENIMLNELVTKAKNVTHARDTELKPQPD